MLNEQNLQRLEVEQIADMLEIDVANIMPRCRELIDVSKLTYTLLEGDERDKIILRVLKTLDEELTRSGKHRHVAWEDGWRENLEMFVESDYDTDKLIPKYFNSGKTIMRIRGDYIDRIP